MKKSSKVNLVFLSSFAAGVMSGCGGDDGDWVEAKRCVDDNNVVVEDRLCETSGPNSHYYSHYYGGHGYYPGDRAYVVDGLLAPARVMKAPAAYRAAASGQLAKLS
jgi:hypothetical protein